MRARLDKNATRGIVTFIQTHDNDDALERLSLVAILTAFGIEFSESGSQRVSSNLHSGYNINWTFQPQSTNGKHNTAELVATLTDRQTIADPGNETPEAIAAAALHNFITLIRYWIAELPAVELTKSGSSYLVLPQGIPLRQGELLIKQFTRK